MSRDWRSSRNSVERGLCTVERAKQVSVSPDWHLLAKQMRGWEALGWAVSEQCEWPFRYAEILACVPYQVNDSHDPLTSLGAQYLKSNNGFCCWRSAHQIYFKQHFSLEGMQTVD